MLNHIAIIMDGNGRWGELHYKNRNKGHQKGVEVLEQIVKDCMELNLKALTVYAFSTENFKRPKIEVNALLKLFYNYLDSRKEKLNEQGIKLIISGSRSGLSKKLIDKIDEVTEYLKDNDRFILNICFNYGGRLEIVETVNKLIKDGKKEITANDISSNLYARDLEDPDLIIRTGGDYRLSNFLIWQMSYSELYFTKVLWPDFNKKCLVEAIEEFKTRNRKFGGLNVK